MSAMDPGKYRPYPGVDISGRTWPDRVISRAPAWCSVDLRDGNQALERPMSVEEKMVFFDRLVRVGFREIEVGFPSASQIEFDFMRKLIEENRIPPRVTVQVLTQAREHLVRRTFEALKGCRNAIVHVYNSTSEAQRRIVFRKSREEIMRMAVSGVTLVKDLRDEMKMPGVRLEYSPESFTGTELDYALDVCSAVREAWKPSVEDKIIFNLPATVEMSTPNVYADRIEWFCRRISGRESVIVSVHTHNDRGCAVAAAEMAVMAGAERVEGSLFGNGERTGNMDIMTMAMNLYSQGVDPGLDFSRIDEIAKVYEQCTQMKVHPRHPYAGSLVYTAFSGSHQDAIHKGMKEREKSSSRVWDVPYLPIDPEDVGRAYGSVVRVNSQSGKSGAAHVLERDFGFRVPEAMKPDFGRIFQSAADRSGKELSSREVCDLFELSYMREDPCALKACRILTDRGSGAGTEIEAVIVKAGQEMKISGRGNGPVDAFVRGLREVSGEKFSLDIFEEHALGKGSGAKAVSYVGIRAGAADMIFGAGVDENISLASIKAVLSAVNRRSKLQADS